jgi:hypothetical protein
MAKSDFIPRSDADFLLWHDHFLATAIARQAEAGLADAEIAAHQADNLGMRAISDSVSRRMCCYSFYDIAKLAHLTNCRPILPFRFAALGNGHGEDE